MNWKLLLRPASYLPWLGAVFCLATSTAPSPVSAAEIHPSLKTKLAKLRPDQRSSVIFTLADQADVAALSRGLRFQQATRTLRHFTVVSVLQETATRSQAPFLAELERLKRAGDVDGYTAYWISNLVVVEGSRAAIESLAQRPDVSYVESNFEPVLIRPVDWEQPAQRMTGALGAGATPGIRAIRADRVWSEFGINGEGTIVSCLDTGVDGTHPALHGRWRGHSADPSECWLDVNNPDSRFPRDRDGHGTHVTGTMAGLDPTSGDSVGIAWGAHWIASNGLFGAGEDESNYIIDSFQWFADPDGDPNTVTDVPDVVQNSWGVRDTTGIGFCASRWWSVIDNCEAAGVVVTFSAGNDGPLPRTILSPQNRADTPYRNFAIGAVNATFSSWPFEIALFSSRGPTNCSPGTAIKPEVVAPGVEVFSTTPGATYSSFSGTSMAGPHVAGVVALMRQVNPGLEVDEVKRILMETAQAYGPEDNVFGAGLVDAYAAVLAAAAERQATWFVVEVRDQTGGAVEGAEVRFAGSDPIWTTREDGKIGVFAPIGTHTVEVSHPLLETQIREGVRLEANSPMQVGFVLSDRSGPLLRDIRVTDALVGIEDSIRIAVDLEDFTGVAEVDISYRQGGRAWYTQPMAEERPGTFVARVQPERFGETVDLFLETSDLLGHEQGHPEGGRTDPIAFTLSRSVFQDDGETDLGWSFESPGDTRFGIWDRHDPFGTAYFGKPVEPENDRSPDGAQCFVTGRGRPNLEPDRSDVDEGCVTLTSPILDLSEMVEASLLYWRWFAVEGRIQEGSFRVEVSGDGGATWSELEHLTGSEAGWIEQSFPLAGLVALGPGVQVRFVACDIGEDSLVEAAVDDIWIRGTPTPAWVDANSRDLGPQISGLSWRPNPYRETTFIHFDLLNGQEITIDLFDTAGRQVRKLWRGQREPGVNEIVWDGTDDRGEPLPTGIYLYRLRFADGERQGKIALLR